MLFTEQRKVEIQERQIDLSVDKHEFHTVNRYCSKKAEHLPYQKTIINKSLDTFIFCRILVIAEILNHIRKSRGPRASRTKDHILNLVPRAFPFFVGDEVATYCTLHSMPHIIRADILRVAYEQLQARETA